MPRRRLTDKQIAGLRPTDRLQNIADTDVAGLYIRLTPAGVRSFAVAVRNPEGRKVWHTLGRCDALPIADAREQARKVIARIKAGLPPVEAPRADANTLAKVASNWIKRHVQEKGLRSEAEITRLLKVHVLPAWGEKPFASIRRKDVNELLDTLVDERGKRTADYVLAVLRSMMNWQASRDETYVSPIVAKMRRAAPVKRDRILDDEEIRRLWQATEVGGTFAGIVRLALLTAQRREKVGAMRWADLDGDTWHVPHEDRQKGVGGALVLPKLAMNVIDRQPRIEGNGYVFAGRADRHFMGWSDGKERLDRASGVTGWTLHDLRRTARSLLSRAGVRPDVGERTLGHAIAGVEGVYDRHRYVEEKADALRRLADLIETIVNGPASNVVPLRR